MGPYNPFSVSSFTFNSEMAQIQIVFNGEETEQLIQMYCKYFMIPQVALG